MNGKKGISKDIKFNKNLTLNNNDFRKRLADLSNITIESDDLDDYSCFSWVPFIKFKTDVFNNFV